MSWARVTRLFRVCGGVMGAISGAIRVGVAQALHNQYALGLNMVRRCLRNRRRRQMRQRCRDIRMQHLRQQRAQPCPLDLQHLQPEPSQVPIPRRRHPLAQRPPRQLLQWRQIQQQHWHQEDENLQRRLTHARMLQRRRLQQAQLSLQRPIPCECQYQQPEPRSDDEGCGCGGGLMWIAMLRRMWDSEAAPNVPVHQDSIEMERLDGNARELDLNPAALQEHLDIPAPPPPPYHRPLRFNLNAMVLPDSQLEYNSTYNLSDDDDDEDVEQGQRY